jgi:enamine deaminase RidA (YjgF/YER057c/UK114 family)
MTKPAGGGHSCFNFPGPLRPGYSEVVRAGPWVSVSGQVPTLNGVLVGGEDAEAQVRQMFANMATALGLAGAGLADVVKLTCFLVEERAFPAYVKVKQELFQERPPAGTVVIVSGLMAKGAFLEVEALAYSPQGAAA